MARNYRKLESSQDLTRLMTRYYATQKLIGKVRPVAWVTSGAPVEILIGMGIATAYPENYGAILGAQKAAVPTYAEIQPVLAQRCLSCHGEQLQMKNVRLDTPEALKQHAQAVYQQAVVAKLMPMNNATGMTDAERDLLGRWFQAGAKVP